VTAQRSEQSTRADHEAVNDGDEYPQHSEIRQKGVEAYGGTGGSLIFTSGPAHSEI